MCGGSQPAHFKGEGAGGWVLLSRQHVPGQDRQSRSPRGLELAPSWSWLMVIPCAPSQSEHRPRPSLLQGRPVPTKGFPGIHVHPESALWPPQFQCPVWPGSGLKAQAGPREGLPGQRDPRRLRSETNPNSRLSCVVLGESLHVSLSHGDLLVWT